MGTPIRGSLGTVRPFGSVRGFLGIKAPAGILERPGSLRFQNPHRLGRKGAFPTPYRQRRHPDRGRGISAASDSGPVHMGQWEMEGHVGFRPDLRNNSYGVAVGFEAASRERLGLSYLAFRLRARAPPCELRSEVRSTSGLGEAGDGVADTLKCDPAVKSRSARKNIRPEERVSQA